VNAQFIISKIYTAYLVTVTGREVAVEPIQRPNRITATKTISDTLQIIGNTKLMLMHPEDPVSFLKQYYISKGWEVESSNQVNKTA
jgi:hypothetical protein